MRSSNCRACTLLLAAASVCVLVLVAFAPQMQASGNQRPLSDWLSQQGTTSVFFPPAPDLLGFTNGDLNDPGEVHNPTRGPCLFALTDYCGAFAAYLHAANPAINLGTTVTGSVTEEPLADGRARVHVVTHTTNSLTWVFSFCVDPNGLTLVFGRSAADVLSGATDYALGSTNMDLTFINTAPGAPLPNIVCSNLGSGACPAGYEMVNLGFSVTATGPLHAAFGVAEGTPGMFRTVQKGLSTPALQGPTPDTFPVEFMYLKPIGSGKSADGGPNGSPNHSTWGSIRRLYR